MIDCEIIRVIIEKPRQAEKHYTTQFFKIAIPVQLQHNPYQLCQSCLRTNQAEKLGKFFDILRIIQDKVKITLSRRDIAVTVESQQVNHACNAGSSGVK